VQRALDGLAAGADEVLADVLTEQIRQGLAAPRPVYLPQGLTTAATLFSTAAGAADAVPSVMHQALPASIQTSVDTWKSVETKTITAGDVTYAYRELGKRNGGTPVVFLVHLAAVLDNWDPRIMDGIAAKHHVIAFDNRGIGASSGSPSNSMEANGRRRRYSSSKLMGFKQVDLLGFSMGGMVAQEIVLKEPQLVRKMVLAGTGPAGGEGISAVAVGDVSTTCCGAS
jgi:hypothetical protein